MKKKNVFVIMLSLIILLALIGQGFIGCAKPAPAGPIRIEAISFLPKFVQFQRTLDIIADKVNERSNGELDMEWIGGPEIFGEMEQVRAVSTGTIDIVLTFTGYYLDILPEGWGHKLSTHLPQVERENGYYDWFDQLHREKTNTVYLARNNANLWFYIFSTEPVETSADMAGLRYGVSGDEEAFIDSIGGITVSTGGEDMYVALDQRIITAVIPTLDAGKDQSFHEVAPYVINDPYFGPNGGVILMNLDKFNSLSKRHQEIILQASEEAETEIVYDMNATILEAIQILRDSGVTFVTLKDDPTFVSRNAYAAEWNNVLKYAPDVYDKLRGYLTGGTYTEPLFTLD